MHADLRLSIFYENCLEVDDTASEEPIYDYLFATNIHTNIDNSLLNDEDLINLITLFEKNITLVLFHSIKTVNNRVEDRVRVLEVLEEG